MARIFQPMKLSTAIGIWLCLFVAWFLFMYFDLAGVHREKPAKPAAQHVEWKDVLKEPYGAKLTQGIEQVQIVLPAEIYGSAWTNMLFNFEDEFAIRIDNFEWASEYCRMKLLTHSNSPTIFHFNLMPK